MIAAALNLSPGFKTSCFGRNTSARVITSSGDDLLCGLTKSHSNGPTEMVYLGFLSESYSETSGCINFPRIRPGPNELFVKRTKLS